MAPLKPQSSSEQSTKTSDQASEVPDGYAMLPHGLGLVKIAQNTSTIEPSTPADPAAAGNPEAGESPAGAGRYFLRRRGTKPSETQVHSQGQKQEVARDSVPLVPAAGGAGKLEEEGPGRYALRGNKSSETTGQTQRQLRLRVSKPLSENSIAKNENSKDQNTTTTTNQLPAPPNTLNEEPPKKRRHTSKAAEETASVKTEDSVNNGGSEETREEYHASNEGEAETKVIVRKRIPVKDQSPYQRKSKVLWGETPWPEHIAPLPEICENIYEVLKKEHVSGKLQFERPAKIQPPSLEVAGCGETPLLLDGLCRTVLSGATTMKNANTAIQNVSETYGTVTKSTVLDGAEVTLVQGCIDWNNVRLQGQPNLKAAIHCGGLQEVGSKAIIGILEKTYAINSERTAAFIQEKATGVPANVPGSDVLTQGQKDMEIWMFENGIISLEHLRVLSIEAAMNELVSFPGVGVKTAACVILFSLQEPCFAVDTHCFRLAQWLGWLPVQIREDSGREKAFAHLNLRIPDHLKYGLHQLFIEHGQTCHRCKSSTRDGNKDWDNSPCPLDHLLSRNKTKAAAGGRKRKEVDMEEEAGEEEEAAVEEGAARDQLS